MLNSTKPSGNILDFRQQQDAVNEAIALFSGEKIDRAREIWLVDKAPKVIEKLQSSVKKLDDFMKSQGLTCKPEEVPNLKGDDARSALINHFKEVQRLKTQLDQYTDLTEEDKKTIEQAPGKQKMSREQLIGLIQADAKFMDERDNNKTLGGSVGVAGHQEPPWGSRENGVDGRTRSVKIEVREMIVFLRHQTVVFVTQAQVEGQVSTGFPCLRFLMVACL